MSAETAFNLPIEQPAPDGRTYKLSRLTNKQVMGLQSWAKGRLKQSGRGEFEGAAYMEWCLSVEALPFNAPAILNQIQSPDGLIEILLRGLAKEHPGVTGDAVAEWFWQEPELWSALATQLLPGVGDEPEGDGDPPAEAATTGKQSAPRSTREKQEA